jgi:hypothetical protein
MGNCCSGGTTATDPPVTPVPPLPETRVAPSAPIQLQRTARASSTSLHRPPSRAPSVRAATPHREATPYEQAPRSRVVSAPQKLQPQQDIEWTKSSSSSSPNPRARVQSAAAPRKRNRSDPRPPSSGENDGWRGCECLNDRLNDRLLRPPKAASGEFSWPSSPHFNRAASAL